MRYPSKQDWWIVVLVWGPLVGLVGAAGYQMVCGGPHGQAQVLAGAALFYGGVMWALAHPVDYEIAPPTLRIRCGRLRYRIPLDSIDRVRPSRNPLSAPALSLDRLRIDYRKPSGRRAFALISPDNRAAFLRELAASVDGLEMQGDEVVRRGQS